MVLNVDSRALRLGIFSLALLSTVWIARTLWTDFRVDALSRIGDRASLERAITLSPRNAEFHNRLGRIHLYSPLGNPSLANDLLHRSTLLDPRTAHYWVDLALARELAGDASGAAAALLRARQAEPRTPSVLWNELNFALRRQENARALDIATELLRESPIYTRRAMPLLSRVAPTPVLIEKVIPANPDALVSVFEFLRLDNNIVGVAPAWQRLLDLNEPLPDWLNRAVITWLLARGEVDLASRLWTDSSRRNWIPVPPESLEQSLYNSDFRQPLLNFGFDWLIAPHAETSVWVESRGPRPGQQSLCLQFAPSARAPYSHVSHYISVQPNHHYVLHGWTRSERLTSRAGAYLEIMEFAPNRPERPSSVPIVGTNNWTEFTLRITTGPDTRLAEVRLHRPAPAAGEEPSSGLVCLAELDWKGLGSSGNAPSPVRRASN